MTDLKHDVSQRISRVQDMMREKDLSALLVFGSGAPGSVGAIRYLSNARLWGGPGHVVLGVDDPDPWLEVSSSYQAVWSRNGTTTAPSRVESPDDILIRVGELARDYVGATGRIGAVNLNKLVGVADYQRLVDLLSGVEIVEVTPEFNAIRQIKSPFELEAMRQNGAILDASFDVFRDHARVGARYLEVCAATEAFVKSQGAFWGRTKLSTDGTPYTVPPPPDLTMKEEDIINFEIVYESPLGYWLEMTAVFAFHDLPDDTRRLLDGYLAAVDASAAAARPGATFRTISDSNDRTLRERGFPVHGKHTPDCHSTGLDGSDGPSSAAAPDFVLRENMVLSFHPGTVLEKERGFLISDNFVVTAEGSTRLSPHNADRYFLRLQP